MPASHEERSPSPYGGCKAAFLPSVQREKALGGEKYISRLSQQTTTSNGGVTAHSDKRKKRGRKVKTPSVRYIWTTPRSKQIPQYGKPYECEMGTVRSERESDDPRKAIGWIDTGYGDEDYKVK